ncbi:Zinc finger RING-type domain containing protein [Klebsormidium nitens]|uniref:Zinc finger RING-type domain containing protein n=1 Tax=Klebsormidium nitens TaxID=105231 RepID=A0A1Y1HXA8_KLENI|nr:Zinc finger RING-type domain containing protein [Klebsormidium nitens]|eukprot:GAQ82783.1 Zinc finger RING-type domain containing protein [Klebsormidium nitens]
MEGSDWERFVEDLQEPEILFALEQAGAAQAQSLHSATIDTAQPALQSSNHACGEGHQHAGAAGLAVATADFAASFLAEGDDWICAICRDVIAAASTAQVKGCEHAYCINCILRWATFHTTPWCPQCRLPFTKLYTYKTLDGSLSDVMLEESVCLLLRATWYVRAADTWQAESDYREAQEESYYDDYEEDGDEYYEYGGRPTLRIGNRRWGSDGFVRGGRKEARVVPPKAAPSSSVARGKGKEKVGGAGAGPSGKGKEKVGEESGALAGGTGKEGTGRRAKRQQKREAADRGGEDKPRVGLRVA